MRVNTLVSGRQSFDDGTIHLSLITTQVRGITIPVTAIRTRIYGIPCTPYARLLDSEVISLAQQTELPACKASLDPAAMASEIDRIQHCLIKLAAAKTRQLEREIATTHALPDPAGIKIDYKVS